MEHQNIEYKETWKDEYIKWICGFANASGGTIYIGKDDDGTVKGISNSKKLLEDIPNKIRDILGIIVDVNLLTDNGKDYIEIVTKSTSYPVSYKGQFHYRSGSTKQELKGNALNQFLLKKTGVTWDSVTVDNLDLDDFKDDSFDIFRENAFKSKRLDKNDLNISNVELLESLNLLENGLAKKAAVLLFHHNPEKWIAGAYIKIAYFRNDAEIEYQDEIHGSLLSQIEKIMDLLYTKYLKAHITYDGITRVETYPFPKEAIREAILNAIAHKFYGALIPIQISVYEDKLYIANDCVFPEDWTVDDLMNKHRSRPYNPLIANTLFRVGFIESWGRGIDKIKQSCIEAENPLPKYSVKQDEIMVLFESLVTNTNQVTNQATNQAIEMKEIELKILDVIRKNNRLSQKSIAEYSKVLYGEYEKE